MIAESWLVKVIRIRNWMGKKRFKGLLTMPIRKSLPQQVMERKGTKFGGSSILKCDNEIS